MSNDVSPARRSGLLEWTVLGVAAALLVLSFGAWYGIAVAVCDGAGCRTVRRSADAWQASTAWSAAVVLGVGAALCWALRRQVRPRWWWASAAFALVVPAVALMLWQWRQVEAPSRAFSVVRAATVSPGQVDEPRPDPILAIHRDRLTDIDDQGYRSGARGLSWFVLVLLVAELVIMLGGSSARPLSAVRARVGGGGGPPAKG